jgi:hypothetical protein
MFKDELTSDRLLYDVLVVDKIFNDALTTETLLYELLI